MAKHAMKQGRKAAHDAADIKGGSVGLEKEFRDKPQQLQACMPVIGTQTGMVCRTFVAKMFIVRQVRVVGKVLVVSKGGFQDAPGHFGFKRAVKLVGQVGWREVNTAICCVGTWRDCCRIGGPHA